MIAIPASLRSDFIHIAGTGIHIALESTIHITGIGKQQWNGPQTRCIRVGANSLSKHRGGYPLRSGRTLGRTGTQDSALFLSKHLSNGWGGATPEVMADFCTRLDAVLGVCPSIQP
jgi:hypothetical protein